MAYVNNLYILVPKLRAPRLKKYILEAPIPLNIPNELPKYRTNKDWYYQIVFNEYTLSNTSKYTLICVPEEAVPEKAYLIPVHKLKDLKAYCGLWNIELPFP